jgi:hypothetical protein
MTRPGSPSVSGDWDLRGIDLETRYAKFSREPLPDEDVWALAMAKLVLPASSVGDKLFLTHVSDCQCYRAELSEWALMVARGIAKARYKRPGGQRRREYCEAYREDWGTQAALDGLSLALYGNCPEITGRAEFFGVHKETYRKIRDFVGGLAVDLMAEFRYALEWAHGWRRDRVFDARAESLKCRGGGGV